MPDTQLYGISTEEFILAALKEDVGNGDHTSLATIPEDKTGKASIRFKEEGVLSGIDLASKIFYTVDPTLQIKTYYRDGSVLNAGEIAMQVTGNIRSLLKAERLVLNCMQRMSGIATMTNRYVQAVKGTRARILDTRKTTPNFRAYEKYAVSCGGGENHRFGLFDMILIKDNHVDAAGGIRFALQLADAYLKETGKKLQIEIETRNFSEVEEVISTGIANRIMLDNFSPDEMKKAVSFIDNKIETEASGGITLENVIEYAQTGVQFISVGALTHSYRSVDISMKLTEGA